MQKQNQTLHKTKHYYKNKAQTKRKQKHTLKSVDEKNKQINIDEASQLLGNWKHSNFESTQKSFGNSMIRQNFSTKKTGACSEFVEGYFGIQF